MANKKLWSNVIVAKEKLWLSLSQDLQHAKLLQQVCVRMCVWLCILLCRQSAAAFYNLLNISFLSTVTENSFQQFVITINCDKFMLLGFISNSRYSTKAAPRHQRLQRSRGNSDSGECNQRTIYLFLIPWCIIMNCKSFALHKVQILHQIHMYECTYVPSCIFKHLD